MKLDLEVNEINVVLACLAKQPYELVNAVITKIQVQAQAQVEKKE